MSDSVTLWAVAHQALLFMESSRQEYWSGQAFPSPGDLPSPRIEPRSPTFQADPVPSEPPGKPEENFISNLFAKSCCFYLLTTSGVHLHLYLYQCFIATILIQILIISYLNNYHCLLNDLSASNLSPFQSIFHTILRVICLSNTSDLPVRCILTREAPLFKIPSGPPLGP